MKRLQSFLTLLVLLLVSTVASYAVTREVGPTKTYTTIQAAVTAANGGDIIEVYSATYTENVNIPGGKNGLIIREKAGENAILDGTTVGNPKVAFRVASDNVTIQGFTIQNYNYSGATNVDYGQAQRGIGIEAINASSQHTFTGNTIFNCNWGVYVREGNNITVEGNIIEQFFATSFAGTWEQQGGVGIAFISAGIAMDGNIINDNDLFENVSPDYNYGIAYGRVSGGNVGADFVQITNNLVQEFNDGFGFYAYGIFNIKSGESIDFSNNTSNINDAALDIVSSSASDNDDVTITNNIFTRTTSTIEVRASSNYSGEKLWEVMTTNGNTFSDGGTDLSNAIASLDYVNNIITSDGNHRFILNNLDAGITEAEDYLGGVATQSRVYVTNGTYTATATATVNGIGTETLKIEGQSTSAILSNSFAGIILDIQAGAVEVDPLTFQIDLTGGNVVAINTTSDATYVHHVVFNSTIGGANSYIGVRVNDAADNAWVKNNAFNHTFSSAVLIESDNTVKAIVECNTFTPQGTSTAVGVNISEITVGGNITNIDVISNTFYGASFSNAVNIVLPTAGSGSIKVGDTNKGNDFTTSSTYHVFLTQAANNQVSIFNNKIGGTAIDFINNTAAFDVNAGFNYWNVLTPFATNVPAMIAGAGAANVLWLPIYTDGTDQDLTTCGFQPLLTSLWTPVYTSTDFTGANSEITAAGNEFFLTVEAALNDGNTTSGQRDNVFLYLTQTYAETNAAVMNFNSAGINVAAAQAQPANSNTRPTPVVSSTFAGAMFDVNFDNIMFDKIGFTSGSNALYYPINVTPATFTGLTVTNCTFDVSGASNPDAAILFSGATSRSNITMEHNTFTIGNGNYAVDFGTTAAINNTTVTIDSNTVNCSDNTTIAIRFGQIDDLELTYNNFAVGVTFTAGTNPSGTSLANRLNIYGNTFVPTGVSSTNAISFTNTGVGAFNFVNIQQNEIRQFSNGLDIVASASVDVNHFANWKVNENYFSDMNDGIDLNGLVVGGLGYLDATNNHWESNYGPQAESDAPAWHDNSGANIISNSYGFLYNVYTATTVVNLNEATYIRFVPWWNDNAGSVTAANAGYFVGTSFAPIENNEATPEYFASLIFAIDATSTGFEIYMQDVPIPSSTQTSYYLESNTVENAGKSLSIWGQPFYPPTTKIATQDNGAADNMFLVENVPALGSFNLNFLEFVYDANANEDLGTAVKYGVNGDGIIDWCSFNGIKGTSVDLYVVSVNDATSNVSITNSRFLNNLHAIDVEGAVVSNGGTLVIDNTTFTGNDGVGTIASYEIGVASYEGGNLTITNSTIEKMKTGGIDNEGIYLSSATVAPGTIQIYQNIISNNQYGLWIGDAALTENFSTTQIYNNIIRNNTFGLRYEPGVASTLTVENNSWGSNYGPRSEAQTGGTQENTYNEVLQGNSVIDANANSTIDYIPWRRIVPSDDLATMIAGPRFAPIVRTNAANLAQGLYANFNDAINDLAVNQKIYAYSDEVSAGVPSKYSENIVLNNPAIGAKNWYIIGKLAPATYSVGWILAPNSPIFVNAWTSGTQGANSLAPTIIYGGAAGALLEDAGSNFSAFSMRGFIFNTEATTLPTSPYAGNPTEAINFSLNTDDITFSYNTFVADAADRAINWGAGQHDNWDLVYNSYQGTASGYFAYLVAQTQTTNVTIEYNLLNGGAIFVDKQGAATITNMDIIKNQFSNTSGAITLDGTAGGVGQVITNLNVKNNRFAATNTYAFLVDAAADNAIVAGNNWTNEIEVTNNEILIAPSAQIAVGFANATPLVTYSNEITATCNWWGNATGATFALNPGGTGARASEGVFFAPWLSGNTSSTSFEFTPTDACNVGERVWVNTTGVSTLKTIVFPSLQWAVQHATVVNGTNDHIFVANTYNQTPNYVQENITINWNAGVDNTLYTETAANELKINGNFELAGTNLYNLNLGSDLRIMDNLTLDNVGCQGQFILGAKNLTVEDNITDASYGAVVTNGAGYLVKENVVTGGINRFPVAYTESNTATPAQFVVNAAGFTTAQNNKIRVRVNNTDPVAYKGMGEANHDVNNIWVVDFENRNNPSAPVNPNMAMTLRFLNDGLNDAGFTANKTISYAAYWDNDPVAVQWTTRKSTSSWNGSDGVQITNLNLDTNVTEWALFYGSTSYALSTPPTQAKNIQWIGGSDRKLEFQWQRNGANNQYYAIMAVEGSTTATPSPAFAPQATCGAPSLNGPWACSATDRNFSDGYVDISAVPTGSAFWTASLFHNGATLPANVKVLKVGKYAGASLIGNVTVDSLDQGTYYTFFVANFNYGNGSTAIADMATGADGMANYELGDGGALNPRTRKTQPAVYMTLDLSSAFASDATNQPNVVYGTTLNNVTDSTDIMLAANRWRINGTLQNQAVVRNQYNWDSLTGGNFAQVCEPATFPANNVVLYFKGYGNNGGLNWGIKYSENNSTYTFTTPLVNSNTARTRNEKTTYYLVSAYDGDGKVAALYDNNQNVQLIFDTTAVVDASISGTHPTCEGNAVTFLSQPSSYPNAIFVGWEVYNTTASAWQTVSAGPVPAKNVESTFNVTGDDLFFTSLNYLDNGKKFRAAYSSTSVCDYPNLGATKYTDTLTLLIYSSTLTGTTPAVSGDNTPYLCSDLTPVTFATNDGGPLVAPNSLTLQGWYLSSDNGGSWSSLITGATTYGAATITSVTGVTTTSGTIVFNNADMNLLDGYQVRAEWKNGNCAVTQTAVSTLNIVSKPTVNALTAPAGVCINQPINIASVGSAANTGATQSIQWLISSDNITYNNLATSANATVSGETTANVTITPLNLVLDGYYVKVRYTNSENGTDCVTESNAVQIDVFPTPVFNAIADQTVCENTNMAVTAVDASPTSWTGNISWYHTAVDYPVNANLMTTGNTYFGSTVTINGASNATFTINNASTLWNGKTVIAYNNNGACSGSESFNVLIDTLPVISNENVTPNPACANQGNVLYSIDFTTNANTVQWYYNGNLVTNGTSVAGGAGKNIPTITTAFGTSSLSLANTTMAINGVNVFARVTNGLCNYVQSNNMSVVIDSIPVAPATVGAQNIFSHRFDITWTGVANADDYDVQVSELADFSVLEADVNVAAPAVTWTGMANCALDPAKTYYFRVRANNQCGDGAWIQSNMVTLDPTVTNIAYTTGDGAFGNVQVGFSSAADTYTITYYQLDAYLSVAVPAGYEISQDGGTNWQSGTVTLNTLTLYLGTPGSPLTKNILVRFSPTACGLVTGNLVHSSLQTCPNVTDMQKTEIITGSDDVSGTGVVALPTLAASNGIVMENTSNTFSATWTNGNGSNRLVLLSSSATLSDTPDDNTTYIVGDVIGGGTVVEVYDNLDPASATITVPGAGNYYVHVWEYNACGPNTEIYDNDYYTFQPYYLRFGTTIPNQNSGTESGNVTLNLTQRNGTLIANPFATFNVSLVQWDQTLSNPGTFTTNPSPVQIVNATNNSVFKFTWTDACGVDDGYLTANATNINGTQSNTFDLNVSTPTQQARIMVPVGIPCAASSTFKWTNGNGAGRLFVVRESLLPAAPADFQNYGINANWTNRSAANHIGDSTYVMGVLFNTDSPNNQITVTNLSLDSTYYFRAYEFNGCDIDLRKYNVLNATFNPRSRTINCKEGNNLHDIVLDKFNAVSNSGKGILNFNTLYEANISGFELRRMNTTDEEMGGILVGSYMNNPELVAEGNTMTGKSYNFTDNSSLLEVGKSYLYQLIAIAFDGTRIEVAETELTINDDIYTGISEFSVSPVIVTNNEAKFDVTVNKAQNVTITLYDVAGQAVATIANNTQVTRGTQQFTTNIQNVTNGTYMIVVEADGVAAVQKFQIVR